MHQGKVVSNEFHVDELYQSSNETKTAPTASLNLIIVAFYTSNRRDLLEKVVIFPISKDSYRLTTPDT
jgi:hypothetical protein